MRKFLLILLPLTSILIMMNMPNAYAQEAAVSSEGLKYLAAAIAFSMGAISAGFAIGKAGSAGLAAAAEKLELRTQGLIISALGEAIAIYGIVVALLILGG